MRCFNEYAHLKKVGLRTPEEATAIAGSGAEPVFLPGTGDLTLDSMFGEFGLRHGGPGVFRTICCAVALAALPLTGAGAADPADLARLKAGAGCPRCDLRAADLKGLEFR